MNENLWLTENDPLVLLHDLYPQRTLGSDQFQTRACRLYLIACARRQWDRLPGVCRVLVELAELFTEAPRELKRLRKAAGPVAERLIHGDGAPDELQQALDRLAEADLLCTPAARPAVSDPVVTPDEFRKLAALVYLPFDPYTPPFGWVPREFHAADLLREIYYNPHRFVPFDPAWRTNDVLALARHVYDAREFSAMPILADALQDAGCNSATVLDHCRKAGAEHVRGCWVLDRVLDRR